MRDAEHPETGDLDLITVLSALADPVRLHLVQTLADGREMAWGDLSVPVSKSTLSHHLKTLRSAGITRTRQEGTRCFVRLRASDLDERFPGLLGRVLAAAGSFEELDRSPSDGDDEHPPCVTGSDDEARVAG